MPLKVKQEFANTVIGFNNSCAPLGVRKDLQILYDVAKANGRKDYLNMFEGEELTDPEKEKAFNEKQSTKHNNSNKSN
jgi:hypothetical protein